MIGLLTANPDGPSPVTVATKHVGIRFTWNVLHAKTLTVQSQRERILFVKLRQGTNSVRGQELFFVQHIV